MDITQPLEYDLKVWQLEVRSTLICPWIKIWFTFIFEKWIKFLLELQIPSYLISNEIFHSEKNIWQLNITLASKTASNLFLPFLLLDLTISGSKLSHAAWRLSLGLKKLLWTLNHQDFLNWKVWTAPSSASWLHVTSLGQKCCGQAAKLSREGWRPRLRPQLIILGTNKFFLLENCYKSLEVKGFSHDCNSSLRIASFCSTGTYGSPCTLVDLFPLS